jgi:hypothetical protein
MYVVGGYNEDERETSDAIYQLSLTPHYTTKLLARMPQPRSSHTAEIVKGKLFVLGGEDEDALDSVVVYDFITNTFTTRPPLPTPVSTMSTVTWGNMIIVVGGEDNDNRGLNDVIMYDTETGRSQRLPSLQHKRSRHSAVIVDDVIVVLGGWREGELTSVVETFTMGSDGWKEHPGTGINVKRGFATVVAKPRT